MKRHRLKCWSQFFEDLAVGAKSFEVRQDDDRNFSVGDLLELVEYDPIQKRELGPVLYTLITYTLPIDEVPGLGHNTSLFRWVVLGLRLVGAHEGPR